MVVITNKVRFPGYVESTEGVMVDEEKIQVIRDWPAPSNSHEARNFHGLPTLFFR